MIMGASRCTAHPQYVKLMRVPQALSQLFAILVSRILEVIYKPRDRALSVHIAARLRLRTPLYKALYIYS